MTFRKLRQIICSSICLALLVTFCNSAVAQNIDFALNIKPIFEKHCVSCHGPEKEESFRIDDREDARAYLEPDEDNPIADESPLFTCLESEDEDELMPPPDENNPLSENEIQLVKAWVNQGAQWPEGIELVDKSPAALGMVSQDAGDAGEEKGEMADPKADAAAAAKTQQIFNAIGSLHPAAVHLPIGLLLAAGLFALFSLRGNFVMSDCAYYCLWLGTFGAIIACATGWWFSPMENKGTVTEFSDLFNQEHKVFWHRTGGLIVTAVAFLLALFAAGARNRDPDDGILWKLGLIVLAGGIGWVGHTGGELHYPSDHYEDLNGLYQDIISGGDKKPKAEMSDEEDGDGDGDEDESILDINPSIDGAIEDANKEVGEIEAIGEFN